MIPLIVTALIVAVLPVAVILFKTPGSVLFLLVLAGAALEKQFGEVVRSFTNAFLPHSSWPANDIASIGLCVLPVLLCVLLVRKVAPMKTFAFQIASACLASVIMLYEVHQLGGRSTQQFIEKSQLWPVAHTYYGAALALGIGISFLAFFLSRPKEDKHSSHKRH